MTAFLLISTGILLLIAVPIGMAMGTASLLTILQGGTLNALIIMLISVPSAKLMIQLHKSRTM